MVTRTSPRPRSRGIHLVSLGTVVGAIAVASAVVWTASYSGFSSTTSNGVNNWSAGTVTITDDDTGTAMFNATNLKPGSTGSQCIAVTSTGSLPSAVKLYGSGYSTTNALAGSLNLTVTLGTGGTFGGGCGSFVADATNPGVSSGTLAAFAAAATGYSSGLGTWAPTGSGSATRTYRFDYTLDPAAPNSVSGGTAAITFVWEAQST